MTSARRPLRTGAVLVAVTATGALTVALGAFVGLGIWVAAVLGGGLLGALATLTALGIAGAARGTLPASSHALIDPVTGLANIDRLHADLDAVFNQASPARQTLCVHVLDGLKRYNDAYGEACGDALLAWLARRLSESVGSRGSVYRMRGGCFAVLAGGAEEETSNLRADSSGALFEVGDGFVIWSATGEVTLPDEAQATDAALELADRRAHSVPPDPRADADLHPPEDPIEALPMVRSRFDVGELARRIARRMGIPAAQLADVEAAAYLRDIGNMAIPSAVLTHAGELPGHEWRFIRLHTVVGQRLLAAKFGMEDVGRIVRCSHERWDGAGYPDGLSRTDIPLGSRIVFVCAAFEDMTNERPHRPGLDPDLALAELDRGAGTQFDPDVVSAFHEAFAADGEFVRTERALYARRTMRVLLAGADPVARFLLRRAIEAVGHECVAVADGLSAWETYRRALPEVVICDLMMAQLGGIELCQQIRSESPHPTYCILLAGAEDRERLRREMHPDADAVLAKPVDRLDLEVTLTKAAAVTARQ